MATLEKQTHRVGPSLQVGEIERLLALLSEQRDSPCAWHLDLSETRHIQPLAGARLAAAMKQLAHEHLSVTLPPDNGAQRYRVLYRSGLLAAIAAHASEVDGEDRLLERVREDPHAYSGATNLIVFNRVDDGGLVVRKDRFASRLWTAMSRSLTSAEHALSKDTRAALVEVGYEGLANIADHAYTRPFENGVGRTAFCMMSWHQQISAAAEDRLGLASYIERARTGIGGPAVHWLHLVLVDDGNGIPARHALDPEIYAESIAAEETALAQALETGSSVKLTAADAPLRGDPGWGLSLIADALIAARGYGCLRTGRHLVEANAFAARQTWTLHPDPLAPLRGTVLEFVFPVEDPQGRLV